MAIELSEKQIKDGWQIVKFGEIAKEMKSTTKNPAEDGLEFYVGLDHLAPQSLRIARKGIIAEDNPSFTRRFSAGQILFGKRRCYQKKAAVADFEGICSGDIIVMEAIPKKIIPGLLPFIIQSDAFFDWAEKTSSGSLSPRTKWKSLAEFEFPLPPVERQKEILEVLEKLEEISLKNESLMHNGDFLFRLILQDKTYHVGNDKHKSAISQIATVVNSPVDKKTKKGQPSVKLCNYMDVYNNRQITSEIEFMNASASQNEIDKFTLHKGDVVITKDSETPGDIGVPTFIAEEIPDLVCGYHLAIIRPNKTVYGKYLSYVLSSPKARHDFIPYAQGMTRFGLSSDAYKKIKIHCPAIDEQNKICSALDLLQGTTDRLKKQAQKYNSQKRLILQELLLNSSPIEGGVQ